MLIRERIYSDYFQGICLTHFPEWEYSLYTRAASTFSLSTPLVICWHSVYPGGHVLIHFHPRFCVTQQQQFSLVSLLPPFNISYICQLPSFHSFHNQRSGFRRSFLLGSGVPYKRLSRLISCRCCAAVYACPSLHLQHVSEQIKVGRCTWNNPTQLALGASWVVMFGTNLTSNNNSVVF